MPEPVYRYTITDRATVLLNGGYLIHEVVTILCVEFTLDEFQVEDLPKLVRRLNDKRQKANAL